MKGNNQLSGGLVPQSLAVSLPGGVHQAVSWTESLSLAGNTAADLGDDLSHLLQT